MPSVSRVALAIAWLGLAGCARDGFVRALSETDGEGDDAGVDTGASGDVDDDGDAGVLDFDLPPQEPNLAFVTSTAHAPTFVGLAGADFICTQRALAAGLDGVFVAFLWSTALDPALRLEGSRGWVDLEGRPIADTVATWRAQRNNQRGMINPLVVDERGARQEADQAWFGSASNTCTDWTGVLGGSARVLPLAEPFHQSNVSTPCSGTRRLVCLEIGRNAVVAPAPVTEPARLIFTTLQPFQNDAGAPGADALCGDEAAAVGLTGTFLAFLAIGGQPPEARFRPSDDPVRRVDGALFARTAAELLDIASGPAYFETFLDLTAAGAYQPFATAVGVGANCEEWSTQVSTSTHGYGNPVTASRQSFRADGTGPCSSSGKLVCLQD